jgi:hypothetical protein
MEDENYLNKIEIIEYPEWCITFITNKNNTDIALWNNSKSINDKHWKNAEELLNWSRKNCHDKVDAGKDCYYMYYTYENWEERPDNGAITFLIKLIKNSRDKWVELFQDYVR